MKSDLILAIRKHRDACIGMARHYRANYQHFMQLQMVQRARAVNKDLVFFLKRSNSANA